MQDLKDKFLTPFIESATMEDIDELIEMYLAEEKPTQTLASHFWLRRSRHRKTSPKGTRATLRVLASLPAPNI